MFMAEQEQVLPPLPWNEDSGCLAVRQNAVLGTAHYESIPFMCCINDIADPGVQHVGVVEARSFGHEIGA